MEEQQLQLGDQSVEGVGAGGGEGENGSVEEKKKVEEVSDVASRGDSGGVGDDLRASQEIQIVFEDEGEGEEGGEKEKEKGEEGVKVEGEVKEVKEVKEEERKNNNDEVDREIQKVEEEDEKKKIVEENIKQFAKLSAGGAKGAKSITRSSGAIPTEKLSAAPPKQPKVRSLSRNSDIIEPVLPYSPAVPRQMLPASVDMLNTIEKQANCCAANLTYMTGSLRTALHAMTSISLQSINVYKDAVNNTTEAVAKSTAEMRQFIAKCQSLNDELKSMEGLAADIKEIRKALDQLEAIAAKMTVEEKK